jgi:hypothetical protein
LYDYSFKNNIEFGVYSEVNFLDRFTTSADSEAWQACFEIADSGEVVFIKRPVYEKKLLSNIFGKNYIKSDTLHDTTDKFYSGKVTTKTNKKLSDFQDELELGSQPKARPTREEIEEETMGYCIRTRERIPFNPKRPYCEKAYKSWARFGKMDYREKYCHKTGKLSDGKTSMRNPILD